LNNYAASETFVRYLVFGGSLAKITELLLTFRRSARKVVLFFGIWFCGVFFAYSCNRSGHSVSGNFSEAEGAGIIRLR
jgi:hypothetical protein